MLITVSNRFASRIILSSLVLELVVIEVFVSPEFLIFFWMCVCTC